MPHDPGVPVPAHMRMPSLRCGMTYVIARFRVERYTKGMTFRPLVFLASVLLLPVFASGAEKLYDPLRDPAKDLQMAEERASAQHKNILLDVGGNWCSWCLILEKAIHTTPALQSLLDAHYVVLHVNWSPENNNDAFLKKYGKIEGFPHLVVLSATGSVLANTETDVFETDHTAKNGYNVGSLEAFLTTFAGR